MALFFTGIAHAHYSYYSVERDAQITLRRFFQFAAFLSETFVFAFLGLQVGWRPCTALDCVACCREVLIMDLRAYGRPLGPICTLSRICGTYQGQLWAVQGRSSRSAEGPQNRDSLLVRHT